MATQDWPPVRSKGDIGLFRNLFRDEVGLEKGEFGSERRGLRMMGGLVEAVPSRVLSQLPGRRNDRFAATITAWTASSDVDIAGSGALGVGRTTARGTAPAAQAEEGLGPHGRRVVVFFGAWVGTKVVINEFRDTSTNTTRGAESRPAPEGRAAVSGGDFRWTMQAKPAYRSVSVPVDGAPLLGTYWYVDLGERFESVYLYRLDGRGFDLDRGLQGAAEPYDGVLSGFEDVVLGGAPGRAAAINGTIGGHEAVGFAAVTQVDDQVLMVAMLERDGELDDLRPQFLELVASVDTA